MPASIEPATEAAPNSTQNRLYEVLVGDERAQVCRDIPESACHQQAGNFSRHLASLSLTKIGDALADPKLVIAWLLTAVGAPAALIGMIVPLRESLAMLPQLVISARIRQLPIRKTVYMTGCVLQGVAMLGMGATGWWLTGAAAGWSAIGLIVLFALARSLCSISHKDVLGKTVSKGQRGTVTGSAGTVSASIALLASVALAWGWLPLTVPSIATMVLVAGLLWMLAAFSFAGVHEEPGATEGGINGLRAIISQLGLLKTDAHLRWFILTRSLLLSTALAPPYYLAVSGNLETRALGSLGSFMLASALAGLLSTYVWGRLADVSSRKVMMLAAAIAAVANLSVAAIGLYWPAAAASRWALPGLLFVLMIAHQGVRLGRSTHVIDMAGRDNRATYTALSNSIVGLVLLLGGGFGVMAQTLGNQSVLLAFAGMAALALLSATRLREVQ